MLYREAEVHKKKYSKIDLFIRSLLFSIYSLTTMTLYSFLVVVAIFLPLSMRYVLIRAYIRVYMRVLKFICRINYQVHGLENLKDIKNGIVLSKHQSTWETFFLPLIFHDPAVIAKRELLWIPFFGWGLAASEPISINRAAKSTAMQQIITKGKRCLAQGRWIIVFPEGTRVAPGHVGHYRLGGARLGAATGYPIIPVAHNAGECWPRRKFIKRPGTIHVMIGPAIETNNRPPEVILEDAKTWIETTMKDIPKLHR